MCEWLGLSRIVAIPLVLLVGGARPAGAALLNPADYLSQAMANGSFRPTEAGVYTIDTTTLTLIRQPRDATHPHDHWLATHPTPTSQNGQNGLGEGGLAQPPARTGTQGTADTASGPGTRVSGAAGRPAASG